MTLFLHGRWIRQIFALKNETKMDVFVLNDETKKNSHGFYLMNAGGRFDRFRENPSMFYNHNAEQLIGKWMNLRAAGSLLLAEPEFDAEDPEAVKIKGKVERGYLKGASIALRPINAEYRLNSSTQEQEVYVTEWEMMEASICAVPSNPGALRLYDENNHLLENDKIPLHIENIIRLSVSKGNQTIIKKAKMSEIKLTAEALVALGIKEDADGAAISAAVVALKAKEAQLTAELATEKQKTADALKKQAEEMVDLAVKAGKITADKKESFVKLALADFDTTKSTLDAIPEKQSLAAQMQSVAGGNDIPKERENWTLLQWMKTDMAGLNRLKAESPEAYDEIAKRK